MKDPVFRKALARFERATRAEENCGAQSPQDWPAIIDEFNSSKIALIRMVEGVPRDQK